MDKPEGLSPEAEKIFHELKDQYQIKDAGGLLILRTAMEALIRMRQAQEILEREGMTVLDRFSQPRGHPAATIERDSRSALLQALKALNLDLEPLQNRPGRPTLFDKIANSGQKNQPGRLLPFGGPHADKPE